MRLSIFAFLLPLLAACQQTTKIPADFDYGKIDNSVYSNTYFDFDIPVPEKWAVQNKEQVQRLQKQGEDAVAGNNAALKARVKAADIQTAILLTVFKNSPDSVTEGFNPSFIILAENLGTSGVSKARDYLSHAKGIMKQSNMSYEFEPDYFSEKVGNKAFDGMNASLNSNGPKVHQTFYTMVDRNFALSFIISYTSEEERTELKKIINKINFR